MWRGIHQRQANSSCHCFVGLMADSHETSEYTVSRCERERAKCEDTGVDVYKKYVSRRGWWVDNKLNVTVTSLINTDQSEEQKPQDKADWTQLAAVAYLSNGATLITVHVKLGVRMVLKGHPLVNLSRSSLPRRQSQVKRAANVLHKQYHSQGLPSCCRKMMGVRLCAGICAGIVSNEFYSESRSFQLHGLWHE